MDQPGLTSALSQFGLMNRITTGNSFLDIILCMLVPLIVNRLLPALSESASEIWEKLSKGWSSKSHEHCRTIIYTQKRYYSDEEDYNDRLQQAILLHINRLPGLADILVDAEASLIEDKQQAGASGSAAARRGDSAEFDLFDENNQGSQINGDETGSETTEWYDGMFLQNYRVTLAPPLDIPIDITPRIKFTRTEITTTENNGGGMRGSTDTSERKVVFSLSCSGPDGAKHLDGFIKTAYEDYLVMLKGKQRDCTRYMYVPMLHGGASSSSSETPSTFIFRRYALSDDKSFANFFHPEKLQIISLVENFQKKGGKFAITGYPHKLGFLLHGPPGTGKTSFIKALAQLTKRSILNVPLSRVKTNQELMDLMFAQKVQIEGENGRVPLPFHKVIYVMEDVDAASHVVQRRGTQKNAATTNNNKRAAATATASVSGWLEGAGRYDMVEVEEVAGTCKDAGKELMREAYEAANATASPSRSSTKKAIGPSVYASSKEGDDALNLAGLLNVLDGVVDTPGRLIIMTSNHPEKLDPALIRPGRINRKIYMGNLAVAEALAMTKHYFADQVTEAAELRLREAWVDGLLSPATLESMCAEFESVEELLEALEDLPELHKQQEANQELQLQVKDLQMQPVKVAVGGSAAAADDDDGAANATDAVKPMKEEVVEGDVAVNDTKGPDHGEIESSTGEQAEQQGGADGDKGKEFLKVHGKVEVQDMRESIRQPGRDDVVGEPDQEKRVEVLLSRKEVSLAAESKPVHGEEKQRQAMPCADAAAFSDVIAVTRSVLADAWHAQHQVNRYHAPMSAAKRARVVEEGWPVKAPIIGGVASSQLLLAGRAASAPLALLCCHASA